MAYFVPSSTGITLTPSSTSVEEKKYSPVYDEDMSMEFLLDEIPDFYRNFLSGTSYLTSVWGGVSQVIASDLLSLFQADYAKSLRDIPVYSQRKWVKFDLQNDVAFDFDPEFTKDGVSNKFVYSSANQNLSATFTQRSGATDRYRTSLQGTVNQESSLVWSMDVNIASAQAISTSFVGYQSSDSADLAKSLLVGLVFYGSSSLRLCIAHTPTAGVASATSLGSNDLSTGKDYTVEAEYSSSESTVRATAVEKRFERVSSSTGTTSPDPDGKTTVRVLEDSSTNFLTSGVAVGDFIVFGSYDHKVVEVAQNSLTTEFATLPASASAMTYTVVGPKTVDSVSLNLLTESSKTLSCDSFGLAVGVPFDLRSLFGSLSAASFTSHTSRSMVGTVDNISYSDPTFSQSPIKIPRLQNYPLSPTSTKRQNVDYIVQDSQISFSLPTRGTWYAEFGLFNEEVLYDNFGETSGIEKETPSDEYLNRIRGLYYSLLSGPTVASIKTGVLASVGLPIAVEAGEVTSINTAYSGQKGQITIGGSRTYLYPLAVGTDLTVGDSVAQFAPLSRGVEVYDYISNPGWINDFPVIAEVQKYHTFLVSLDLDALDVSVSNSQVVFSSAVKHLQLAKPTHKDFVFVGKRSLSDVTGLDDTILLSPTLHVEDAIKEPYPAYDDQRFYVGEYDWAYDQGQTEWEEIPASITFFAYENTEAKLWRGSSDQSQFLAEANAELEEGTFIFSDSSYSLLSTTGQVLSELPDSGSTDSSASMIFTGHPSERFKTSIPNSGGTPTRDVVVVISSGSTYGFATVTSVLSNTQLQTSYTPATLKGLSSVEYEVRSSGPTGTILLDEANGGTVSGGSLDKFRDTGGSFSTDIPNTGGIPNNPTYVAINPSSASPIIREVTNVDSATQVSVSPDWAGTATNEDYAVWVPKAAVTVSRGDVGSVTASGSSADISHTSVVSSTSGQSADRGDGVIALKDASNNPMTLNIDENHALIITSPGAIAGSYRVTGLYSAGGSNWIVTSPAIASAHASVTYEVRRGRFHEAVNGSILVINSGLNAGTYTISSTSYVTDSGLSACTISGAFPASATASGLWYTRADVWTRVSYVASDTKMYFTKAWPGTGKTSSSDSGGGTGSNEVTYTSESTPVFLSEVDLTALGVLYDQAEEFSPDERVELHFIPEAGFGLSYLTDNGTVSGAAADSDPVTFSSHTASSRALVVSGYPSTTLPITSEYVLVAETDGRAIPLTTDSGFMAESASYVIPFKSDLTEIMTSTTGTASGDAAVGTNNGVQSISFDGTGDFVTFANSAGNFSGVTTGDFYIGLWIYIDAITSGDVALGKGMSNFSLVFMPGGEVRLFIGGSSNRSTIPSGSVSTGAWTHIQVERDGSNIRWYVNGVIVTDTVTGSITGSISSSTPDLVIGANTTGSLEIDAKMCDIYMGHTNPPPPRLAEILYSAGAGNFDTAFGGRSALRGGVLTVNGGGTSEKDMSGASYSNSHVYLARPSSGVVGTFSCSPTNGSADVVFTSSPGSALLSSFFSAGDLVRMVSTAGNHSNTDTAPLSRVDSIVESGGSFTSGDKLVLSSTYAGTTETGSIVILKQSASSMASSLGSKYTLTNEDYEGVLKPGTNQTMIFQVPENEF